MKSKWVYDEENLKDFHCTVFIHRDTNEIKIFEISKWKNDLLEFQRFLKTEVGGLWGYNNNQYDDPILERIYKAKLITAEELYYISQEVIDNTWNNANLPFPTADIFKMLHFDRKRVSLKWCEFQMDSESIEEMPINHWESVETREIADKVINYCIYDVEQTKKIINKFPNEIQLRLDATKEYKFRNPLSMSNTALGKDSMLIDYCKLTGDNRWEIKKKNTQRAYVSLKDVIHDNIKFETKKLQDFLTYLKSKKDNLVYKAFKEVLLYDGVYNVLAKGGLHGTQGQISNRGKVNCKLQYESNDDFVLLDFDFDSFYPNLIHTLNISPLHLNSVYFIQLVKQYTEERVMYKRQAKDKSLSKEIRVTAKKNADALKIKINSIYGLLGEENSFLFDLHAMYSVTLNGQLYLLMLNEKMLQAGFSCFYNNTDGSSFIVKKDELDKAKQVCIDFSKQINISGEFNHFKKAFISDVNNFVIIEESGDLKLKGKYVYENIALEKNASNRISTKAAVKYLVKGIPIKDTIESETDIYQFCIGKRARNTPKKGLPVFTYFDKGQRDNAIPLQKTIRYIVSNTGGVIKSVYQDDTDKFLEAYPNSKKSMNVWYQTVLNKVEDTNAHNYDIDYKYYIKEALNLIEFKKSEKNIIVNQLKLF